MQRSPNRITRFFELFRRAMRGVDAHQQPSASQQNLQPATLAASSTSVPAFARAATMTPPPSGTDDGKKTNRHELLLANSTIESLADGTSVTMRLDVSQCHRLKKLPDNFKTGILLARECTALETLPRGLDVAYLDLAGCTALTALPEDLRVRWGRLTLRDCHQLKALPASIGPLAELDLAGCLNVTTLPPSLIVTSWIDVGGSGLTSLPPHLDGVHLRWRGVPINERIAFHPERLNHGEILAEGNAEVRRVMMERFGLDRFMRDADAKVLDADTDAGGPRRLLRIEIPNDEALVCVSVISPSTKHHFMLRVPPAMQTCRQAVAWTAGFEIPEDYRPILET